MSQFPGPQMKSAVSPDTTQSIKAGGEMNLAQQGIDVELAKLGARKKEMQLGAALEQQKLTQDRTQHLQNLIASSKEAGAGRAFAGQQAQLNRKATAEEGKLTREAATQNWKNKYIHDQEIQQKGFDHDRAMTAEKQRHDTALMKTAQDLETRRAIVKAETELTIGLEQAGKQEELKKIEDEYNQLGADMIKAHTKMQTHNEGISIAESPLFKGLGETIEKINSRNGHMQSIVRQNFESSSQSTLSERVQHRVDFASSVASPFGRGITDITGTGLTTYMGNLGRSIVDAFIPGDAFYDTAHAGERAGFVERMQEDENVRSAHAALNMTDLWQKSGHTLSKSEEDTFFKLTLGGIKGDIKIEDLKIGLKNLNISPSEYGYFMQYWSDSAGDIQIKYGGQVSGDMGREEENLREAYTYETSLQSVPSDIKDLRLEGNLSAMEIAHADLTDSFEDNTAFNRMMGLMPEALVNDPRFAGEFSRLSDMWGQSERLEGEYDALAEEKVRLEQQIKQDTMAGASSVDIAAKKKYLEELNKLLINP